MEDITIFDGKNDIAGYLKTIIGSRFFVIKDNSFNYIGLFDKENITQNLMNNVDSEKQLNLDVVNKARGDVLIAGLGIGLIVLPIMNKEEVISVDIVEKQQEVIDLIKPQLPLNSKVNIICEDIIDFKPTKKYDIIFFDTLNQGGLTKEEQLNRTRDNKFLMDCDILKLFEKDLKEGGESLFWTDG